MQRKLLLGLLSAVVIALLVVAAGDVRGEGKRHCVVKIDPIAPGERDSVVHDLRCFRDFAAAISEATNGTGNLPPTAQPLRNVPGEVR